MGVLILKDSSENDLERKINGVLADFENSYSYEIDHKEAKSIIDIKYSCYSYSSGLSIYTAMIIFET